MSAKKTYLLLLALLGLTLVGLVAGAYGINVLLTKQSSRLVSLKAQSQALTEEQTNLAAAKRDIATYSSLEQIAKTIVPQDKDQAEAVREIVNIASASNVVLDSIVFPTSSLGTSPTASSSANQDAAAPTTAIPSANASSNAALSQLTPVPNIPGVYSLQIVIGDGTDNPVTFSELEGFLTALEHDRRTAQVSALTIQPVTTVPGDLTFTLTINEYIKPS